uniref:PDZ and LIM domain protein Zasp n=1 Tax=Strigamia maritima TaxID=126957 RepID=T1JNR5_STRMM
VAAESIADKVGLQTGDAILKINGINADSLRHKDAQDVIIRAGNNVELLVQRGAVKTWKPTITPLNQLRTLPKQDLSSEPLPVTRTSLAANKQNFQPIGNKHNVKAKPFGGAYEINGSDRVTALVHKQYNSPAGLYSMQNIADTLSAQAEVLTGGVKGINFMKPDAPLNKESAVYKMVKEEERCYSPLTVSGGERGEAEEPIYTGMTNPNIQSRSFRDLQRTLDGEDIQAPRSPVFGPALRSVEAPITKPTSATDGAKPNENLCYECGRLIVGVFVRIKDKNLHAECFKCNTCGANLKNVGYYNINEKLYCDIHAKQVARQNPPNGNLTPVTVPSGVPFPKDSVFMPTRNAGPAPGSPRSYSPTARILSAAPGANVHKPTAGAKFVWPPPRSAEDESMLETSAAPSAPSPVYRAPPSTQHTHYTPAVFKSSPRSTPPPRSFSPRPVSPALFSSTPPVFKPVSAPAPSSPWGSPSIVGTSFTGPKLTSGSSNTGLTRPAPVRGKGVLKPQVAPGTRIPICAVCGSPIRGPFVTALGKTWCPDHFHCVNSSCRRPLQDIGFVEEQGQLYCELCFETYLAPICSKCNGRVKGDCLNAVGKSWHPECFVCSYCHTPFGNSHFYLEDGQPYCEKDWNDMFTTKCVVCGYPIEAGDRWVEALNSNYHSQCFKCSMCNKNLEGQSFFAKGGRPFCKAHSR